MIIIADAHISKTKGNHTAFFEMLKALEGNEQDLVFLGDIFDLWIALPRYEEDIHRDFIVWCQKQKIKRTIGYMEGNHEFYLAKEQNKAFTWCSADAWWRDDQGNLFVHGDQINRGDKNYLGFRKLTKNATTKFILRYLPFGPKVTASIKHRLEKTNTQFRLHLPDEEMERFAKSRFAEGADTIFVGHFHQQFQYRHRQTKQLYVLPDWLSTRKITLYQPNPRQIESIHWKELNF